MECSFASRPARRRWRTPHAVSIAVALMVSACAAEAPSSVTESSDRPALETQIRQFAPVDISADVSALPPGEQAALVEMVRAAELMDGLFLEQAWAGNTSLMAQLAADRTPDGQAALHYFLINKGPWSRLDHNAPFVPGADVPAKPPQANFYPADATRDEVAAWVNSLSANARSLATGFYSVIRRGADGKLMAVPYHVEYRNVLLAAADHLKRASALTTQPSLKKFLDLRAAAFLSNDYCDSDVAWMELDASIEPTIGPYETYEDEWFGYKAAFEAFITLRDDAETVKLSAFSHELQGLEDALPIDARYRRRLGALAPIRVVNSVFSSGDGNRGVQTAAFNLPNDERVVRLKGSKRVMLKNVQEAKFEHALVPISRVALAGADQSKVSFDAFFTHILMHELMHGLGPKQVYGKAEGVRQALKDTYSALEEAKADISGLWALQQLADKGTVSPDIARSMYTTFLASCFRSIRFGITEAHGKGIALQLNYLLDKGAYAVNPDGTFRVVDDRIRGAVADLTRDLMTMQAVGDYEAATTLLSTMVTIRPEVKAVLDKLTDVPVDIEPRFTSARAILAR